MVSPGGAGSVGNRGDGELQIILVKERGGLGNNRRENVAVGPIYVFKVELEAGVAVVFAGLD